VSCTWVARFALINDLPSALFRSIPAIATAVTAVVLGSLAYKDKSKSRMIFTLAFAFASVGYACWFFIEAGIQVLGSSFRWAFIPMIAAILIAASSSLMKLKNVGGIFKGFLPVLAVSTIFMFVQTSVSDVVFSLCFGILSLVSVFALTFLVGRRRETSDLLLFMSFLCFILSVIAENVGLVEEYTVLLSLFATMLIGLVFAVTRTGNAEGLASLIVLQDELQKAQQDLKSTQERAQEELAASEERFRTLCEDARVFMLRLNRKGTVTYVNRIVNEYGVNQDEIVGKNMLRFIPKRHRLKIFKEHVAVIRGKNVEGETEIVTPKGRFFADYVSNPVREGGRIVGCETVLRDITEKKEMEKKLEEYASRLEAMVEAKTIDLRKSEQKLVRYSQRLEELVEERTRQLRQAERMATIGELAGMVGHDLRNPLTSMAGAVFYIKSKSFSDVDPKAKEMLDIIEEDIRRANKIINDLLEYSRKIKLELETSSPKTLVAAASLLVEIPKNIRVVSLVEDGPEIVVDVEKMKRCFMNLIKNAVEAMPNGGSLTVKSREVKDTVEFTFTDEGIGMSKKTLENIWSPLFTTKAKGMGFGLPICKRFIEAHGGNIRAQSKVGKGTTFTVTIPIKHQKEETKDVWIDLPETVKLTRQE
jgi:PAS domain S-box-containing protein